MLWAALLLSPPASSANEPPTPATDTADASGLEALATWALQFTPRVAIFQNAVVLEVEGSVRLFGGKRALRDRIVQESVGLGSCQAAWATNSVAALALARAGIENGFKRPLDDLLDALPIRTLSATLPHATTLAHLGCTKLGAYFRPSWTTFQGDGGRGFRLIVDGVSN